MIPRRHKPLVSIIIPVYNGANYLKQAIDSALAQTYDNCEIVIVDDGSCDGGATEAIVREYLKGRFFFSKTANKIRYYQKTNGGVATALNLAVAKARGRYISWLSHDDLYLPEKITRQLQALEEYGQDAVVACNYQHIDANGTLLAESPPISEHFSRSVRCYLAMDVDSGLNGCSLLIPKQFLLEAGGFPEDLLATQDYATWFKLASQHKFIVVRDVLMYSRLHDQQGSLSMGTRVREEADDLHARFIKQIDSRELNNFLSGDIGYFIKAWSTYYKAGYVKTAAALLGQVRGWDPALSCTAFFNLLNEHVFRDRNFPRGAESISAILSQNAALPDKPTIMIYSNVWLNGGMERVIANILRMLGDEYNFYLVYGENYDGPEAEDSSYSIPDSVMKVQLLGSLETDLALRLCMLASLLHANIFIGCPNILSIFLPVYELMRKTGPQPISWVHNDYFLPLRYHWLQPVAQARHEAFSHARAVVWPTSFSANAYALHSDNGVVISNPNSFAPTELNSSMPSSSKKLLYVGRFYDEVKRVDFALRIFRQVLKTQPEASLVLVGAYDLQMIIPRTSESLGQLIDELEFPPDSLRLVGEQEDVAKFYAEADLLLHTSESEGFGMVLIEAGAFGLPVVAWNLPVYGDILENGKNALLVPLGDEQAMTGAVCRLLADPQLRLNMGKNALSLVERFAPQAIVAKWRQLFSHILESQDNGKSGSGSMYVQTPLDRSLLKIIAQCYEQTIFKRR